MIYPYFTTINATHKKIVDEVTKRFPPYCDFQFSNLLSWSSHKNPTKFALINGNLVINMKEYSNNNIITMFMGDRGVSESIDILLNKYPKIERIPEEVIDELLKSDPMTRINIFDDSNNNDYILDLSDVAGLTGKKLKSKRKNVKAFKKEYPDHAVQVLKPDYKALMPIFIDFFQEVAKEKGTSFSELEDELEAVDKLLKNEKIFSLHILGLVDAGKLIGFTINEILHGCSHKIALGCFGKGLRKYKGIYAYLEVITASYLLKKNMNYINIEEDIGFPGLRESKRLWRPAQMLRKYVITK